MNLRKVLLTNNGCYKENRYITPKGVMVHSTGANNTSVARYVQPNDGVIGDNKYNNDWNRSDVSACVHAFIGTFADGSVGTVQTLPWNMRGWHAGTGTSGGSANNTHISFEICEDGLTDGAYFAKVYQEAVELTAMLCKTYNLDPTADGVVICHSEGYKRGIASNHSDVMHWFPKHGKSMDTFRTDVKAAMGGVNVDKPVENPTPTKSINEVAKEVIAGKWGNGTDRKSKLEAAGYNANEVQAEVNRLLGATSEPEAPKEPAKTVTQIAQEIIKGLWGNGTDRKSKIEAAGYDYSKVQAEVNRLLGATSKPVTPTKTVTQIAQEVIAGKWGNGTDRKSKIEAAGYDYSKVQDEVNRLLGATSKPVTPTKTVTQIAQEVIKGLWGNGTDRRNRIEAAGYNYSKVQAEVNRLLN